MLNFFNLDVINETITINSHIFVIKQSSLLHRNYFISHTVHHQYFTLYFSNMINISKMVIFEFNIVIVLVIKHAR